MVIERKGIGYRTISLLLVIIITVFLSGCKISLPKQDGAVQSVPIPESPPVPRQDAPVTVEPVQSPPSSPTPSPVAPPTIPTPPIGSAPLPAADPKSTIVPSTQLYEPPAVAVNTDGVMVRPEKKVHGLMLPDLFVDVIDVGPGQSILVRTPLGRTMLLDCGPKKYAPRVAGFLRSRGILSLDILLITNFERDRIGACQDLLAKIPVRTIIQGIDVPSEPSYDRLMDLAAETDVPVQKILHDTNLSIDPEITFSLIVPYDKVTGLSSVRSRSLLTRITYGDVRFLLTSDCEQGCERAIRDNETDDMHATVYTIGAHAAERSGTRLLLENLSAQVGILSANRSEADDDEPFKETLKKYTYTKMSIYRTDYDGTVTVATDGDRYTVNVTGGIEHWDPLSESNTTLTATTDCPFVAHYNSNFYYTFDCPLAKLVDPGWKLCFATREDADGTARHLDNRCA